MRTLRVGDHVVFVDALLTRYEALVTGVVSRQPAPTQRYTEPDCNVAYVSVNPLACVPTGRLVVQTAGVAHRTNWVGGSPYWAWPDEVGIPE